MTIRIWKKKLHTCDCGQTIMFGAKDFPDVFGQAVLESGAALIRVGIDDPICPACGRHFDTGPDELWEPGHSDFEDWLKELDQ